MTMVNYPVAKEKLQKLTIKDFSKGLGPYEYTPGYYYWGWQLDARKPGIIGSGPNAATLRTGIAANEKTIKTISVGADEIRITTTTAYISTGGTADWTQIGANGTGWTVGNPTDIVAFQVSGGNPIIAVAMGSSVVFQYTVNGGTNWVASTRAGNAKYANYFAVCAFGRDRPIVKYVTDPNMLFASDDLLNGTTLLNSTEVGDAVNDEFNSIIEDDSGVLLMGKRRILWTVDSSGNQYRMAGPYTYKATGDLGIFTGYPQQPGNVANFYNPVQIEGRVYYVVEQYRIIEYDHGAVTEGIEPSRWTAAAYLRLPVTAIAAVGKELWVGLSDASSTLVINTHIPGRDNLFGNRGPTQMMWPDLATTAGFTNIQATSTKIYAGRREGDGSWIWHGALIDTTTLLQARYMRYNEGAGTLEIAAASQTGVNTDGTRRTVPLTDIWSTASVGTRQWMIETGTIRGETPSTLWRARLFRAGLQVNAAVNVGYRAGEDYDPAPTSPPESYVVLNSYTANYRALTGTRFPPGTAARGMNLVMASNGTPSRALYWAELEFE